MFILESALLFAHMFVTINVGSGTFTGNQGDVTHFFNYNNETQVISLNEITTFTEFTDYYIGWDTLPNDADYSNYYIGFNMHYSDNDNNFDFEFARFTFSRVTLYNVHHYYVNYSYNTSPYIGFNLLNSFTISPYAESSTDYVFNVLDYSLIASPSVSYTTSFEYDITTDFWDFRFDSLQFNCIDSAFLQSIVDSILPGGGSQEYQNGYKVGYQLGYTAGQNSSTKDYGLTNLLFGIADTPILMMRSMFGFDIFGTPVLQVILSLFTFLIVLHIVKRFVK